MKNTTLVLGVVVAALGYSAQAHADAFKQIEGKSSARKAAGYTVLPSKKGGSGIQLSYKILGTPTAGKALTVVVLASGRSGQITMTADNGLTLQDPAQVLTVEAAQPSQHSVVVTPQADGRYYLNFFSQVGDNSSASAVAIQVGNSTANQKSSVGTTQTMPDGKRVKTIQVQ
jgi:hypothetical protein